MKIKQPATDYASTIMALVMVIAIGVSGCEKAPGYGEANPAGATSQVAGPPSVATIKVPKIDITHSVEMPGTVEGYATASLFSKVGGFLHAFAKNETTGKPFDIGDQVTEGQELAKLWAPELHDAVNQKAALIELANAKVSQADAAVKEAGALLEAAKAALAEKIAQLNFRGVEVKRYEDLVSRQSVRREMLDQAKFQFEAAQAGKATVDAGIKTAEAGLEKAIADSASAKAQVEVAKANAAYAKSMLGYATIKAPFTGVITERAIDPGAFVQPAGGNSAAKSILTITQTNVVRVFVDIPMTDSRWIDRGDKVKLDRITALPGVSIDGTITRYSPSLKSTSRLLRAEVELKNEDGRLRPGYFGYMTVYLEEQPDTPVIPSSALLSDGSDVFVFVVESGVVHRRVVTVSYRDGSIVGINSGLTGGESVVRSGGGQLTEGQSVTPSEIAWKPMEK